MKILSKYYVLSLIVFFYLLYFFSFTNEVFARGGGGGSGGGGGGGGGSGGGGSCVGPEGCLFSFGILIVMFIVTAIYTWYVRRKQIKKAEETIEKAETGDTAWQESVLSKRVTDVFIRFQKDWSDNNAEPMKDYCVPKFQEKMALELAVLKLQNRKNSVNNPNLKSVVILEADDEADNTKDNFTAEITAQANDQLIDTTSDSILMTDNSYFTEYWNFLRDGNDWKLNTIRQATENKRMSENNISLFADHNGFFYDPDFGWLMMPNKGVIFKRSNFKTSDINNHVIGMFKSKIVEFYTFIPAQNNSYNKKNYLVAQTTLPVNYNDILVRRRRWFWNFAPYGLRRIETESNDFNKKFCLYANPNDQINSFVLLAPDFMEEVYDLPFELNIEIVGSFLYFYVKGRKNVNEDEMMRLLSRAFDSMRAG